MKLFIQFVIFNLISVPIAYAKWDQKVIDLSTQQEVSHRELFQTAGSFRNIVLGEKHYTNKIQQAQTEVIRGVVKNTRSKGNFTVGWEFLNIIDQKKVKSNFNQVKSRKITAEEFLLVLHGHAHSAPYAPIIEQTARLDGDLIGVNLSRKQKAPILKGGLSAIDSRLIPPNFELGSDDYFERFYNAMKDHAGADKIQNYYEAQCLTDDVIAHYLSENSQNDLRFLVIGGFHSDYLLGAVERLKKRDGELNTVIIRFVDLSDYQENEINDLIDHSKYGLIADFVYFVNEPKTQ